jgi:hypothetical protein
MTNPSRKGIKGFPVKHGKSRTLIYQKWKAMIKRCRNPNDPSYARYGARGIDVCDSWMRFENFYADMGDCQVGLTLERINNKSDYHPGNCRWATPVEQSRNRSTNYIVTAFGISAPLASWFGDLKAKPKNEYTRAYVHIKKGRKPEDFFFEPGLTIAWG